MAGIASALLESPEDHIGMLKSLREIGKTNDPVVQKFCLLTQLSVYRDIIPGYRIRPLTDLEKQQKVSKDVKKLRSYEEGLVSNYQAYLQQLEGALKHHLSDSPTSVRDPSVATAAIRCMTELLTTVPHFNFRINLMTAVVGHMATRQPADIGVMCCNAVKRVFKSDVTGETSLEAVRLISKFVKARAFKVGPEVLGTFLHLRLKDELASVAEEEKEKAGGKRKRDEKVHMSKKARKVSKLEKEVQEEMKEAEAEVDREQRKRTHTETLKFVFTTYFRVLKGAKDSPLLPITLDGLSRFAHLINVDFFADLIKVLKEITFEQMKKFDEEVADKGTTESALHCIVSAYRILSGQAEAINIDLRDFNSALYTLLLRIAANPSSAFPPNTAVQSNNGSKLKHLKDEKKKSELELAFLGIDLSFSKRKQIPITRAAAFVKRIMTVATALPAHGTLAAMSLVRNLFMSHSRLQQLLDAEERLGAGAYLPHLNDPELCNPFSATMWEVQILQDHYHPAVRTLARYLAQQNAADASAAAGVTNYRHLPPYLNKDPRQMYSSFNAYGDGFEVVPPATIPGNVAAALRKKKEGGRKVVGPAMYEDSEFLKEVKECVKSTGGREVEVEEDDVLERLVRRERKLRAQVEMAKEARIDLLDEEASEDEEDEEEEEDDEGDEGEDVFPTFIKGKMNGMKRAEAFLATLKGPSRKR
ncbi:CBF/Mak21 family-domain-containing protein [Chytridium lagenaria]|nr:CBF/Mak21 family-domain-containing protein [Chytridium lagenaria]